MKLDLKELVEAGIIDQSTANKIAHFYEAKRANAPNRILLVFGVLGAILVGLGIILIIAHNWDDFPRFLKNSLAFLPMLIGQLACGYTLWKKSESIVWRESASAFLVFGIGACLATISQIYNIQGDLGSFLLTWLLLGVPLIYVMNSSITSLLYIWGVLWFSFESGFDGNNSPWWCWGLLAIALPHYYRLWQHRTQSNFFLLHSWALAIVGLILLGTWEQRGEKWLVIAYASGLAIYYFLGKYLYDVQRIRSNPFLLIGVIGTVGMFIFFSFRDNWQDMTRNEFEVFGGQEFWVALLLTIFAIGCLVRYFQQRQQWTPFVMGFLLFLFLFLIAFFQPLIATIICNIFVLYVGIFYIVEGNRQNSLGLLNFGLSTMAILIIARFMDIDMSFIARGILFIGMGIGFFYANYRLVQSGR